MKNNKKTFIIAEMAWAHDGSVKNAKRIIKGAKDAGADAVSIHVTHLTEYMSRDFGSSYGKSAKAVRNQESMYEFLEKNNLSNKEVKELFIFAKKLGLAIVVMPNDFKSFELCRKMNPNAYVLAAACFVEKDFVIKVAKEKKPMILRIGGATLPEIEKTVGLIKKQGNRKITLLHGVQSYPTKLEDTNLNILLTLKKRFKLPVGLADHIAADSAMAMILPLVALGMGVEVIEKHLTYDRSKKGIDYVAALNPDEFKKLVVHIRDAEKALGNPFFGKLSKAEDTYRKAVRKRAVAAKDFRKGESLKKDSIVFKRANAGFYPDEIEPVVGRKAAVDIKKDESIEPNKLK